MQTDVLTTPGQSTPSRRRVALDLASITLMLSAWLALLAMSPIARAADAAAVAPDWVLDTADGTTIRFHDDARGAPAVLFFWASWCPHCRQALPFIEALRDEFAPRGVRFYALNIWEDGDAVAYFHRHGYRMPLILAADLVAEEYGIIATPGIVVTDRALRVQRLGIDGAAPAVIASSLRAYLETELGSAVATER